MNIKVPRAILVAVECANWNVYLW